MPDWTISGPGLNPTPAHALAARRAPATATERNRSTWILTGDDQPGLAAAAHLALQNGHRVVLAPPEPPSGPPSDTGLGLLAPAGRALHLPENGPAPAPTPVPGADTRTGWDLALFSSGSGTGRPRGYGLTRAQIELVTRWYEAVYQVSGDSVIVTALPVHYNFTFIAGACLASRLGARLHLSGGFDDVLTDAARLAKAADRVVVLANPVVLDHAARPGRPPATVMIDSGGAPLSTTAITDYRSHGTDVREGYGLTETASLTHFDTEATTASLGTVGTAMPGTTATINLQDGRPIVKLTSPATATPLDPDQPHHAPGLHTTDLGHIDNHGRLRLLGRVDDHPIGGLWPHDTLDALGPILGHRTALVRHPAPDQVNVQLRTSVSAEQTQALTDRAADLLGLQPRNVTIHSRGRLLHSAKLTRASS